MLKIPGWVWAVLVLVICAALAMLAALLFLKPKKRRTYIIKTPVTVPGGTGQGEAPDGASDRARALEEYLGSVKVLSEKRNNMAYGALFACLTPLVQQLIGYRDGEMHTDTSDQLAGSILYFAGPNFSNALFSAGFKRVGPRFESRHPFQEELDESKLLSTQELREHARFNRDKADGLSEYLAYRKACEGAGLALDGLTELGPDAPAIRARIDAIERAYEKAGFGFLHAKDAAPDERASFQMADRAQGYPALTRNGKIVENYCGKLPPIGN